MTTGLWIIFICAVVTVAAILDFPAFPGLLQTEQAQS